MAFFEVNKITICKLVINEREPEPEAMNTYSHSQNDLCDRITFVIGPDNWKRYKALPPAEKTKIKNMLVLEVQKAHYVSTFNPDNLPPIED